MAATNTQILNKAKKNEKSLKDLTAEVKALHDKLDSIILMIERVSR